MTKSVARGKGEKIETESVEEGGAIALGVGREVCEEEQERLRVLHRLESLRGKGNYGLEHKQAAEALGLSQRSLWRLQQQYREEGIERLKRQKRSDAGEKKIDESWREFIVETYRKGNRGMRQMSRSQVAKLVESRAGEEGSRDYPSRRSVYRILAESVEQQEQKRKRRSIGWQGETLTLRGKGGIEINVEYSNQVWQCDHTPADIFVVDQQGEVLGRPTLTTVIDTYSRCIMGFHLGMERASGWVSGLALRHAMLPKQYQGGYEPQNLWESYGVPQYLYTDAGADFTSAHIEQVASQLGIVLCLRRRPAEGGIVERPFGTLNDEFFSMLPGYTTREAKTHRESIKAEACLTLEQLEGLLVRYIVDNYNQRCDARSQESRIGRWKAGLMAQGVPPEERKLDLLLMRQQHRRVYQGGYVRFANLIYQGEYLAGYAGEEVVLRYDPGDITTVFVYRPQGASDIFLARAHAQNLATERLSLAEAKVISRRLREARREITNQAILTEIRTRVQLIDDLMSAEPKIPPPGSAVIEEDASADDEIDSGETEARTASVPKPLPVIRVYDYEQLRHEHGL